MKSRFNKFFSRDRKTKSSLGEPKHRLSKFNSTPFCERVGLILYKLNSFMRKVGMLKIQIFLIILCDSKKETLFNLL